MFTSSLAHNQATDVMLAGEGCAALNNVWKLEK
jgi:hypothetical protein